MRKQERERCWDNMGATAGFETMRQGRGNTSVGTNPLIAEVMPVGAVGTAGRGSPGTGGEGTGSEGTPGTGSAGAGRPGSAGRAGPAATGFALAKAANEHAISESRAV